MSAYCCHHQFGLRKATIYPQRTTYRREICETVSFGIFESNFVFNFLQLLSETIEWSGADPRRRHRVPVKLACLVELSPSDNRKPSAIVIYRPIYAVISPPPSSRLNRNRARYTLEVPPLTPASSVRRGEESGPGHLVTSVSSSNQESGHF